jgi:hypothetical protein
MRRSPKVAEVLPVLYLRGLSTGDFREALPALPGDDAAGLSATNIARLTNDRETEYRAFQKRSSWTWRRRGGGGSTARTCCRSFEMAWPSWTACSNRASAASRERELWASRSR